MPQEMAERTSVSYLSKIILVERSTFIAYAKGC